MKTLQIIETPDYILGVSRNSNELYSTPIHELINKGWVKAYQPKGNAPELDLPLLPEIVEDDSLLLDITWKQFKEIDGSCGRGCYEHWLFMKGYKAATKVYSEEDLRKAIKMAQETVLMDLRFEDREHKYELHEIIQSLKQPKIPKWFIAEMETYNDCINHQGQHLNPNCPNCCYSYKLKTTTINCKIYLVGSYK